MDNPEETAQTFAAIRRAGFGSTPAIWAACDQDGFVYFRQRIKRMIITLRLQCTRPS
ncbi:MAG: hypothetical protein ACLU9S_22640 [Oscillospiraceae bacterium]